MTINGIYLVVKICWDRDYHLFITLAVYVVQVWCGRDRRWPNGSHKQEKFLRLRSAVRLYQL